MGTITIPGNHCSQIATIKINKVALINSGIVIAKIVIVEIIAEINYVVNDMFGSNAIIEYPNNGIGINKMISTAKNTPTAVEEL